MCARPSTAHGEAGWVRLYAGDACEALRHADRALALAALGRTDEALARLERAVAERLPQVVFPLRDPRLATLHDEARFRDLVAELGLEL